MSKTATAAATAAAVAAPELRMDLFIGFDNRFMLDSWTPLTVLVKNNGTDIRGRLEAVITSGSEYRGDVWSTVYGTAVELPARSRKRFAFTVYLDSTVHPLQVRLIDGQGRVLWARSLNLRPLDSTLPLALFLGRHSIPDPAGMGIETILPVLPQPDFLPDRHQGYDGVALAVLNSDDLNRLRTAQYDALRRWIVDGGCLVLDAGTNFNVLQGPRVQGLIPLSIQGLSRSRDIPAMVDFCGVGLHSQEEFPVLDVALPQPLDPQTRIRVAAQGRPMVLERFLGLGKVIFTVFDLSGRSFTGWVGQTAFWQSVFAGARPSTGSNFSMTDRDVFDMLARSHPGRFVSRTAVAVFCFVYMVFCLGLLRYVRFRKDRRVPALIVLTGVLSVLGIFAAWWAAPYPAAQDPYQAGFMQISLSGSLAPSRGEYYLGVFDQYPVAYRLALVQVGSAPGAVRSNAHSLDYSIRAVLSGKGGDWPGDRRGDLAADMPPVPIVDASPNGGQLTLALQGWSHGYFKIRDVFQVPLFLAARRQADGIHLTVFNQSPYPVVGLQAMIGDRIRRLADVPAATTLAVDIPMPSADGVPPVAVVPARGDGGPHRRADDNRLPNTDSSLVGFLSRSPLFAAASSAAASSAMTDPSAVAGRVVVTGWLPTGWLRPVATDSPGRYSGATRFKWLWPADSDGP